MKKLTTLLVLALAVFTACDSSSPYVYNEGGELDYSQPEYAVMNWRSALINGDAEIFYNSLSQGSTERYKEKGIYEDVFDGWSGGDLVWEITGEVKDMGEKDGMEYKSVVITSTEEPTIEVVNEDGEWKIDEF